MELESFSALFEPLNLFLLAVCIFLLYKILSGGSSDAKREEASASIEKVQGDMTVKQLLKYDGKDPTKPILLAVCGQIYDVSRGKGFYGPG